MTRQFTSPHGVNNYSHAQREKVIARIVERLMEHKHLFDAIAVSGASTMLISSVVASRLEKNIILVRKANEKCYSNCVVEGSTNQRYIFIDDLVSSGNTLKYVFNQIKTYLAGSKMVGMGLYFCNLKDDGVEFVKQLCGDDVSIFKLS